MVCLGYWIPSQQCLHDDRVGSCQQQPVRTRFRLDLQDIHKVESLFSEDVVWLVSVLEPTA